VITFSVNDPDAEPAGLGVVFSMTNPSCTISIGNISNIFSFPFLTPLLSLDGLTKEAHIR